MHLDFQDQSTSDIYKVLAALVVPRPIAWVSTVSEDGVTNIAPYSFFNVMGVRPPIVAFAPGNKADGSPKDTPCNIMASGEFVVNLVDESVAAQMVESAKPHVGSEIDLTGLTPVPSVSIKPPRVLEAPVSMECKLNQILEIGGNRMVIGEVLHLHVRDGIIDADSLNLNADVYAPIGRLGSPDNYCRSEDRFKLS